jgi:DNA-binding response OmpR family regulator
VRLGQLEVLRETRTVRWAGEVVALSPREYAVLDVLVGRAGAVVTKDQLLGAVWGDREAATRNVVEVYVGYLRRKLDAAGAGSVLRTVRGHGYMASTEELDVALGGPPPDAG